MKYAAALTAISVLLAACAGGPADTFTVDKAHPPAMRAIAFDNQGDRMNGIIYLANGQGPHPTVILLHGYPGNEKNLDLAQDMRRAGYNVMFFHYRGSWGSQGTYGFESVIADAGEAVEYLREEGAAHRVDAGRIILMGHSLGGHAALNAAARDGAVSCAAGLAAADFGALAQAMQAAEGAAEAFAAYTDDLMDGPLDGMTGEAAVAELNANVERFSLTARAPDLAGKSILLVAAEEDEAVSPALVHAPMVEAYSAEPGIDLTHVMLEGDHSFSWTRKDLSRAVISWLDDHCR